MSDHTADLVVSALQRHFPQSVRSAAPLLTRGAQPSDQFYIRIEAHRLVDVCAKSLQSGGKLMFFGNGGSAASTGALTAPDGDSHSISFRLAKKESATTTHASRIVVGLNGNCIVPPD